MKTDRQISANPTLDFPIEYEGRDSEAAMFSAQGTVKAAVQALQQEALDFLEKPFSKEQFQVVLGHVKRFGEFGRTIEALEERVREGESRHPEALLEFDTPAMMSAMGLIKRAAKSTASVLILGESGTGKTMAAKTLHEQSHLADRPFVTVSCPSLTQELLESQLFGHVRGAFTGALRDHWGKVSAANGGTLFLDEIGDLPLEIQPKLLRLLQEREYERVGETVTRRADVRIVAATNRDLKRRVAEGAFREDLFYRLNVITVEIPPLRDRPRDVPRIAEHYLKRCAAECGRPIRGFTPAAAEALRRYCWPGNLRELRNTIERSVILATGDRVDLTDFPQEVHGAASPDGGEIRIGGMVSLAKIEEAHIRRVIDTCGSLVGASEVLRIDQATLYRKRKRLGLEMR